MDNERIILVQEYIEIIKQQKTEIKNLRLIAGYFADGIIMLEQELKTLREENK